MEGQKVMNSVEDVKKDAIDDVSKNVQFNPSGYYSAMEPMIELKTKALNEIDLFEKELTVVERELELFMTENGVNPELLENGECNVSEEVKAKFDMLNIKSNNLLTKLATARHTVKFANAGLIDMDYVDNVRIDMLTLVSDIVTGKRTSEGLNKTAFDMIMGLSNVSIISVSDMKKVTNVLKSVLTTYVTKSNMAQSVNMDARKCANIIDSEIYTLVKAFSVESMELDVDDNYVHYGLLETDIENVNGVKSKFVSYASKLILTLYLSHLINSGKNTYIDPRVGQIFMLKIFKTFKVRVLLSIHTVILQMIIDKAISKDQLFDMSI